MLMIWSFCAEINVNCTRCEKKYVRLSHINACDCIHVKRISITQLAASISLVIRFFLVRENYVMTMALRFIVVYAKWPGCIMRGSLIGLICIRGLEAGLVMRSMAKLRD